MKPLYYLFLIFSLLLACETKTSHDALISSNNDGSQELAKDELSVEDIQAIEKQAESSPWMTYNALLDNSLEKTYLFDFDSNATYICSLQSPNDIAMLTLMRQEISKETKKPIFVTINKDNNIELKPSKSAPYKAVVKLNKHIPDDSTENFILKVYKKSS